MPEGRFRSTLIRLRSLRETPAASVLRRTRSSTISQRRLSDGTLRFLSLLTVLCDPDPAPLICLEEPELGLHPDIIRTIGELLVEASTRTQLIVTTHSSELISALGEVPESVVV